MWVNSYGDSSDTVTGLVQVVTPTDVTVGTVNGYWYVAAHGARVTPPSLNLASSDAAVALSDKLLRANTYTGYSNIPGYSDSPTGSLWRTEIMKVGVVQESTQTGTAGKWYVFANGVTSLRLVAPSQGWTTSDPAWAWANSFVASGSAWWT